VREFDSTKKPFVYLITEGQTTAENFAEKKKELFKLVKLAAESKISFVQIREKQLSARLVFELASVAAKITSQTTTKILVNDRADIALAARAAGVHLTSRSLSAEIIRQNFPTDFIVGVSAHTLEEAETAKQQSADFITFSPIFPTPEKERYGATQGLDKLREVCEQLRPFPVVALGGINGNNYKSVLDSGASGFAAIRFLNDWEKLRNLAADLREKI